jgi:Thioredoxin
LYLDHKDELNVAKVDCTEELAKPLCTLFEVRGYPTLFFLPIDTENNGKYVKFEDRRTLETLEKFALNGGYLNS